MSTSLRWCQAHTTADLLDEGIVQSKTAGQGSPFCRVLDHTKLDEKAPSCKHRLWQRRLYIIVLKGKGDHFIFILHRAPMVGPNPMIKQICKSHCMQSSFAFNPLASYIRLDQKKRNAQKATLFLYFLNNLLRKLVFATKFPAALFEPSVSFLERHKIFCQWTPPQPILSIPNNHIKNRCLSKQTLLMAMVSLL